MSAPVVVVGAGECGARAALALRKRGWAGGITLVGAEASLPYERPPLSKTYLTHGIQSPRPFQHSDFDDARIDFRQGVTVLALHPDRHLMRLDDGSELAYSAALLATGARPQRLAVPQNVADRVRYLRTEADALALRSAFEADARVVIVGGGFIGLELASSAVALGARAWVLELAPTLMGRAVPAVVAELMRARHVEAGVDVRTGVVVSDVVPLGSAGVMVTLADGSRIEADVLVAGIGAVPETSLAEAAGLAVHNGIVVDGRFATSAPDVYAAGDCCNFPHPLAGGQIRLESWRVAQEQGEHAAAAILADLAEGSSTNVPAFDTVPWFWSDQHDLGLQSVGLAHRVVTEVVRRRPDGGLVWFGLDSAGILVAATAVGVGTSVARDIKVAERLIGRAAVPAPEVLADPAIDLRTLLRT